MRDSTDAITVCCLVPCFAATVTGSTVTYQIILCFELVCEGIDGRDALLLAPAVDPCEFRQAKVRLCTATSFEVKPDLF